MSAPWIADICGGALLLLGVVCGATAYVLDQRMSIFSTVPDALYRSASLLCAAGTAAFVLAVASALNP